jgi:cytochrome bd-type quinol oxidase subunit 2
VFTNGLRALTTVALAAMFGSIFHQLGRTEDAIQERSAVLMHTCINTAMISIVKTLNLFTRERAIVGRERTKGLYDTSAYVLSKVFGELPIDAAFPLMFGGILLPMVGLQRDTRHLLHFFSALSLQTLTAAALGLTIGALCPSTEAALTMGPSVMVIFILLSGQVREWVSEWVSE